MIFEQLGEDRGNLIVYKWDYGVPVIFLADEGFSIDDQIIFKFSNDVIPPKIFKVNKSEYTFELFLTKEEASALVKENRSSFAYSIKHYSKDGIFIDTLINGWLKLRDTLEWSVPDDEEASND